MFAPCHQLIALSYLHCSKIGGLLFCRTLKDCKFNTTSRAALKHHQKYFHDEGSAADDRQEQPAPDARKARRPRIAPDVYEISTVDSDLHEGGSTSFSQGRPVENLLPPQCPTASPPRNAPHQQTTYADYQHGQYAPSNGGNAKVLPGWQSPNVAAATTYPMACDPCYLQAQQDIWASQSIALPQLLDPVFQASLSTSASSPAPSDPSSASSDTAVDAFAELQRLSTSPFTNDLKLVDMANTGLLSDDPLFALNYTSFSAEAAPSLLPGMQPTDIDAFGSSASSPVDQTAAWFDPTFDNGAASSFLPGMQSANIDAFNLSASLPADQMAAWHYMSSIGLTPPFLPGMQSTSVDPLFQALFIQDPTIDPGQI